VERGTVARGRINIVDQRTQIPIDPVGFADGVEEIIRKSTQTESIFLNEDELSWLRKETWSLLTQSISGKVPKIKQSLLRMLLSLLTLKPNKILTVTLESLLDDAKHHRIIFDPDVKSKALQFLNMLPSSDKICENIRNSLQLFAAYPFLIPYFNTKDEIQSAIKRSFQFFPYEMKDKELLILSYYAYAQYSVYEMTGSVDSLTRFLTAIETLFTKRENFSTEKQHSYSIT
jgi:hypothetical protein